MTNIASFLDAPAAGAPDRPALIVDGEVCSYAQLQSLVNAWASALAEHGIGPDDHVALVDWGGTRAVATTLAAAHLGAATAQMNPLLTPTELGQLVDVSTCASVGVSCATSAGDLGHALDGDAIVLTEARADRRTTPPAMAPGGGRDALVLFTSGTTGLPKAVPISHDGITARVSAYRAPFSPDKAPTVGLMCVPSFHVGGILGLILSLYSGDTTVIQPRFDAGRWLELAEHHAVASSFLVPTMLARILEHPNFAGTDLSSLISIAYGAAAAPTELIRRAMAALPDVAFANVFGQTETLGAYTTLGPADHHDPERIGSVGRPLPNVKVRIVDPDTGNDVADGEAGELWVDSPQNVRPGWLRTGDLARQDRDGYLYPTGRMSDTINRGGEKFGPAEVAEALRSHPDVSDVAVAGIPDPEMGERVGVAVVASHGAPLTTEGLRDWCRPRLASYKLPEIVVFVDALPYNELGKLSRKATAELIANEAKGQ
jgi:long-chain acyl-CoA synthetase